MLSNPVMSTEELRALEDGDNLLGAVKQETTPASRRITHHDHPEELMPLPDKQLYCCKRLCQELICCQPWFHVMEPVNQRTLSIPESFAPSSYAAFLTKCSFTGISVGTVAYKFIDSNNPEFQLAKLTIWGSLSCVLYLILSTLNTILANETMQASRASLRIRTTWVLFELAAHLSGLATFGFYAFLFDYSEGGDYLDYSLHGGILLLVLIDGMLINRIPFRFQHFFGIILPIEILYVLWSYIHFLTDIGNPDTAHIEGSTGAIYEGFMDWNPEGLNKTAILCTIFVFVLGPIIFIFYWFLSSGLFCCRDARRYVTYAEELGERPTFPEVEEGAILDQPRIKT